MFPSSSEVSSLLSCLSWTFCLNSGMNLPLSVVTRHPVVSITASRILLGTWVSVQFSNPALTSRDTPKWWVSLISGETLPPWSPIIRAFPAGKGWSLGSGLLQFNPSCHQLHGIHGESCKARAALWKCFKPYNLTSSGQSPEALWSWQWPAQVLALTRKADSR